MRDVFLCYRAQGAQTAKLFMRYLQSKNYDDVWYSDTEAYGNYKNDIPELIGNAQSAVIFITKDFLNGFTEDSKDGYIECITKLEIIEIEKRIQQKDGFRVLTVFQDREGLSVEEQDILRSVFAESGILCPDSVSHFSQSNMVRFNSRKDVEENLFELLLKDLFPPEYFAKKTVGNFKFMGEPTTVDIVQQEIRKNITLQFSEYYENIPFYDKVRRISSNVFNEKQNDEMISVVDCECARTSVAEDLVIDILFKRIDYHLFHKCLQLWDNISLRINAYMKEYDPDRDRIFTVPNAMGLSLMVVTADNQLVFTKRSTQRRIRKGEYDCSIVEGLKPTVQENGEDKYDVYEPDYIMNECFRAYREEIASDDSGIEVKLNGVILDRKYAQWNIVGTVFSHHTAEQIQRAHPHREDTFEKNSLTFLPLDNMESVIETLHRFKSVGLWDTALATLDLTLQRLGIDLDRFVQKD